MPINLKIEMKRKTGCLNKPRASKENKLVIVHPNLRTATWPPQICNPYLVQNISEYIFKLKSLQLSLKGLMLNLERKENHEVNYEGR